MGGRSQKSSAVRNRNRLNRKMLFCIFFMLSQNIKNFIWIESNTSNISIFRTYYSSILINFYLKVNESLPSNQQSLEDLEFCQYINVAHLFCKERQIHRKWEKQDISHFLQFQLLLIINLYYPTSQRVSTLCQMLNGWISTLSEIINSNSSI